MSSIFLLVSSAFLSQKANKSVLPSNPGVRINDTTSGSIRISLRLQEVVEILSLMLKP